MTTSTSNMHALSLQKTTNNKMTGDKTKYDKTEYDKTKNGKRLAHNKILDSKILVGNEGAIYIENTKLVHNNRLESYRGVIAKNKMVDSTEKDNIYLRETIPQDYFDNRTADQCLIVRNNELIETFLTIIDDIRQAWNSLLILKSMSNGLEIWAPNPNKMTAFVLLNHLSNEFCEFLISPGASLSSSGDITMDSITLNSLKKVISPKYSHKESIDKVKKYYAIGERAIPMDSACEIIVDYLLSLSTETQEFLTKVWKATYFEKKIGSVSNSTKGNNCTEDDLDVYCHNCYNIQRADIFCMLKVVYDNLLQNNPRSIQLLEILRNMVCCCYEDTIVPVTDYDIGSDLINLVENYGSDLHSQSLSSSSRTEFERFSVKTTDIKKLSHECDQECQNVLEDLRKFFLHNKLASLDPDPYYYLCKTRTSDQIVHPYNNLTEKRSSFAWGGINLIPLFETEINITTNIDNLLQQDIGSSNKLSTLFETDLDPKFTKPITCFNIGSFWSTVKKTRMLTIMQRIISN